jgi:hypothetical protein
MSIGSLESSTYSAAALPTAHGSPKAAKAREAAPPPVADQAAATDEEASARSAGGTLGTLVDTYL